MKFAANVKSVKADLAKKEITISLVLDLNDENLAAAEEAATYTEEDAGVVAVEITPVQLRMDLEKKE